MRRNKQPINRMAVRLLRSNAACARLLQLLIYLLLAGGSLPVLALQPSQLVSDTWSHRDGLPEGGVLSLFEDKSGFLWIGTDCCLVRFDGVQFYQLQEELSHFGQYSFARAIESDGKNGFWAAFIGGLGHYNGQSFEWFGPEHGLTHPFVYSLHTKPSPWVGTGGDGLWRLVNGKFVRATGYEGMPGKINDLKRDSDGLLLAATDYGLIERSIEGEWRISHPNLAINKILNTRNGDRWLASDSGLIRFSNRDIKSVKSHLRHTAIFSLLEDSKGNVWAGGNNALYRLQDDRIQKVSHALGRSNALLEDRNKNIWMAGAEGLMRLKEGAVVTYGKDEGLPQNSIYSIAASTQNGLWILDEQGAVGLWNNQQYKQMAKPGSVIGGGMLGLNVDEDDSLWLANGSLNRFQKDFSQKTYSLPTNSSSLVEIVPSGMWIGQTQGEGNSSITFIPNKELHAERIRSALLNTAPITLSFPVRHVQRLYPDPNSSILWIATGGTGLIYYNTISGVSKLFDESSGLPSNYDYSMVKDDDDALWLATRAGVARINNGKVDSLVGVAGMPTRSPVHLHLDKDDRFWITADDGIYAIDRKSILAHFSSPENKILSRRLTTQDGLRSLVVSWRRNGQAVSKNGELFYATTAGLSQIRTSKVSFGETPPAIILSRVKLGEKTLTASPVTIKNRQEHLEIAFSAPDLSNAHRLEFRTRLIRKGGEKTAVWSSATTNRFMQYSNLEHGEYLFEVNVRYSGEPWSNRMTQLAVKVEPKLHERLVFQIIIGLILAALVFVWGRARLKRAEKVEQKLRERVNERTEELRREVEYRKAAEKSAADLACDLEVRVQERTAELELAKMATRRSEERFALAVNGAEDGIWDWDITVNRLYLSPRWLSIVGYEAKSFSVNIDHWLSVVHPDDVDQLRDIFVFGNDNSSFRIEYRMMHERGHYVWVLTRGVVVRDKEGAPIRAAGSQTDITARKAVEEQLMHRQMVDELTGLANRSLFSDRLSQSLLQGRNKQTLIAVIFADIDQFRAINEQHGHDVGDEVLKECAIRIKSTLRSADSAARLGNDEFAILVHDIENEDEAQQAAERVRKVFDDPFYVNEVNIKVTCSMGVKLGSPAESNAQDFLIDSELALAQAKSSGGAQLAHYDTGLEEETKARRSLETELKRGLDAEEFVLFYQPLIDPKSNVIVGFEALARWQHPTRGLLSPYHFIGMLEACGLMVQFSRWVLKTACHQARLWKEKYQRVICVSINVPAHQLNDENLAVQIKQALKEEQLDASSLCLEIVENSLMESQPVVIDNLRELRAHGVKIAIDDFGTGYSSFSYLEQFPVDRVKIDRSFCKSVPENPKVNAILSALLKMIRQLDLEPVVEGVETLDQRDYLLEQNGPNIQGYFYSKPVSPEDCETLIEKGVGAAK